VPKKPEAGAKTDNIARRVCRVIETYRKSARTVPREVARRSRPAPSTRLSSLRYPAAPGGNHNQPKEDTAYLS
jgi:hypothetical protein